VRAAVKLLTSLSGIEASFKLRRYGGRGPDGSMSELKRWGPVPATDGLVKRGTPDPKHFAHLGGVERGELAEPGRQQLQSAIGGQLSGGCRG